MDSLTSRSPLPISRRTFLVASSCGVASMPFGRSFASTVPGSESASPGRAKSTILFFLSGGASHIDMWDMKPKAAAEYRGPFEPIATSAPGVTLCEHLPMLAQQAHHLALVNSVGATVNTNDHHAGYYYNLTGHVPDPTFLSLGNNRTPYADDWPCMGAVVAAKRPVHPHLPNFITLPQKEGAPAYTRPGQFAARLGLKFDPLYVEGNSNDPLKFQVPSLMLQEGTTTDRLTHRHALVQELDAVRRDFDSYSASRTWTDQQQRALSLLMSSSTTEAFDVTQESAVVRARYGENVNGMSLLAARRLVEAGVPFVTVFWRGNPDRLDKKCASGGGWDTHGNNFSCLKDDLLPEFDRAFSALVEDLAVRGRLDETLLLVTSEMGRRPKIGDPRSGGATGAGRDHWTHCLTDVLAGGGVRGGQTYGSSDRFAEYPAHNPVTPADVTKTVFHAMGIHNLESFDNQGRPFDLLAEGRAITELF
ncbi:DUF1501 domain-containing protein [Schlesneria paludicola]|uniref:DUF1501 domain-containing protein n=1 Tax=Schlesneria paludicola TaxID=360056 RepID=UPI000299E058|nr:DUF1501 domain-containing protein [Schlesneria paludicola]